MTKSKIYLVKFSRCYAKKAATPTTQTPFDASAFDLRMQTSITKLKSDLDTFRMGRANPAILARVRVTVGSKTALLPQLAQINIKDPHTLHVVVADQQLLPAVEKAIRSADLSLNPQRLDALVLKVPVPKPSAEYKQSIIKAVQASAESARVAIRLSRRDARNTLKKLKLHLEKDHEQEIDTCTNKYIKEADALYASKQRDIQNQ